MMTARTFKNLLLYALSIVALAFLLTYLKYMRLFGRMSEEWVLVIVGLVFLVVGVLVGNKDRRQAKRSNEAELSQNNVAGVFDLEKLGLSKRETEVLELMAEGKSNQEIADAMFISLSTVKTHASNIYQKLDVKNRASALVRVKDLQLTAENAGTKV